MVGMLAIRCRIGICAHYDYIFTRIIIQNGFWFSVGWCAIFLIPMLISGAILTNYIRRSSTDVHTITEDDQVGYE